MQRAVMAALDVYKVTLSPLLPSACRFYPTCSEYMRDAVAHYGVIEGGWLGVRRLAKCHPFHSGGVDHVPAAQPPAAYKKDLNERTQSV